MTFYGGNDMHRPDPLSLCATAAGIVLMSLPVIAQAIDWNGVQTRQITVFYPGQSSWEWVLTQSDHSGARDIRKGETCRHCHEGEEQDIGATIASGKKLEPDPGSVTRSSIPVTVQVAHDADSLYVRLQWPDAAPPAPAAAESDHESMVTMMLGDGQVVEFTRGGCWGACHDDLVGMPSAQPGEDLTKYLIESRTRVTRQGGGTSYKTEDQLQGLLDSGTYLEYWQARLNPGADPTPYDGYILEKRHQGQPSNRVRSEAAHSDGTWSVVLSRRLKADHAQDKDIVPGKTYTVGFAIHDHYATHRHHLVSFEYTLRLDSGDADLLAKPQ
jgi:cytochrome c-type protein NapC